MHSSKYTSYKAPRPIEFIWANNLATLLIDTVDCSAAVWTQLKLKGKVKDDDYRVFIQNFRSLVLHTSGYIHNNPRQIVEQANQLFNSINKNVDSDKKLVESSLEIFEQYNRAIHHSPELLKLVETANIFTDDGK